VLASVAVSVHGPCTTPSLCSLGARHGSAASARSTDSQHPVIAQSSPSALDLAAVRERLPELDGIRGIAALVVLLSHYFGSLTPIYTRLSEPSEPLTLFDRLLLAIPHLLISGAEAVIVFFVLSGFVLALPFCGTSTPEYPQYFTRRLFRIYVPYVVVTLGAATAVLFLQPTGMPELSEWFNTIGLNPVNVAALQSIVTTRDASTNRINPPVWSLEHEMRVSIVFPLIALFVKRVSWRLSTVAAVWLTLAGTLVGLRFALPYQLADSLHYAGLFVAGATMAVHRARWGQLSDRIGRVGRLAIMLIAVMLYSWKWITADDSSIGHVVVGLGACGLIATALWEPSAKAILCRKVPQWLGQVSYSLYLIHVPVLLLVVYTVGRVLPPALAVALAFPAVVLLASVTSRYIEQPCQQLGRRLATAMHRVSASTSPFDPRHAPPVG